MSETRKEGTRESKTGLAKMLKGGVIMDVVNPEHAVIARDAGAVAVMALERVPADIRVQGGIARMSDPQIVDAFIRIRTSPWPGTGTDTRRKSTVLSPGR